MTLEEAIAHHRWAAENCVGEVRDEHLRMVTWLEELVELKNENAKLRALCHDMYLVVACLDLDRTRLQRHGKDADWRTLEERYEELRAEAEV